MSAIHYIGPEYSSDDAGDGKIYAVRKGFTIGLFNHWNGAGPSATGFKGGADQNNDFKSVEEAARWIREKWPDFETPPVGDMSRNNFRAYDEHMNPVFRPQRSPDARRPPDRSPPGYGRQARGNYMPSDNMGPNRSLNEDMASLGSYTSRQQMQGYAHGRGHERRVDWDEHPTATNRFRKAARIDHDFEEENMMGAHRMSHMPQGGGGHSSKAGGAYAAPLQDQWDSAYREEHSGSTYIATATCRRGAAPDATKIERGTTAPGGSATANGAGITGRRI